MQNACLSLKWHWFGAHIFSVGGLLLTLFVALLSGPRHWYCPQQQSATDANFSRKFYFNTIFLSNIKEKKLFQMGTFWVKKNAFKCYDHKINLWLCNLMPKERECGMSRHTHTSLQVQCGKWGNSLWLCILTKLMFLNWRTLYVSVWHSIGSDLQWFLFVI